MARADLRVIGPAASFGRYSASGGTAIVAGEPMHRVGASYTTGTTDVNTFVLAAADTPVIGTHDFGGIALQDSDNAAAGTTNAEFLNCAVPVPHVGRIRGKVETAANLDTLTELQGMIGDFNLIDYDATGAADGGQLYTIKTGGVADTSGLIVTGGNPSLNEIEVVVDARAYRTDVTA